MSKPKLLLADDSITIQKVVNLTFADEGIEVITVGDGDAAIEKIDEERPDIVLADVNMPGLSGYEVCSRIRQNEDTKGLPVILLVGSFEPFDAEEAERVGANSYLTKPFHSIKELVSQVTALIETSESEPEPVAQTPDADDIEALYKQSLVETMELPAEEVPAAPEVVDAGMDDEMIETVYAGEKALEMSAAQEAAKTAPEEDLDKTAEFTSEPEPSDTEEPPVQSQARSPFDAPADSAATEEYAVDALMLGEPDQRFSHNIGEETLRFESERPADPQQLVPDEFEILELPDDGDGKRYHLTTAADAAASGSTKQVVSLSPELIEMIVQKVVEKIAEKY